jgi:uncharacterized protein YicC (UPF0701 family)
MAGCSPIGSSNSQRVGRDENKAVTVFDDEVKSAFLQIRWHVNEDRMRLNCKVYMTQDVNATPDGSIRVYSGLMDLMTDQELRGVLGHDDVNAIESVLRKLAALGSKEGGTLEGMLASHADSGKRADRIVARHGSQTAQWLQDGKFAQVEKRLEKSIWKIFPRRAEVYDAK